MTDFVRRHKLLTVFSAAALLILPGIVFAGHRIEYAAIDLLSQIRSRDKYACTVNPDNATQIVYNGATYQILNERTDPSQIGAWTGVLRKAAVLDGGYRVIWQRKSEIDWKAQMRKLADRTPVGGKYIVTYFNAFTLKSIDQDEAIAVDLSGGFYRAVPVKKQNGEPALTFSRDNSDVVLEDESGADS